MKDGLTISLDTAKGLMKQLNQEATLTAFKWERKIKVCHLMVPLPFLIISLATLDFFLLPFNLILYIQSHINIISSIYLLWTSGKGRAAVLFLSLPFLPPPVPFICTHSWWWCVHVVGVDNRREWEEWKGVSLSDCLHISGNLKTKSFMVLTPLIWKHTVAGNIQ